MKSSLKVIISQKVFYPLWGFLAVLVLLDITMRLVNTVNSESSLWVNEDIQFIERISLNEQQANKIITAANHYEIGEDNVNGKAALDIDPNSQQGDLGQVYTNDFRYRLVGIIKEQKAFAIVQQHNIKSKENKLVQVFLSEKLDVYEITHVLANKIILQSDDNREIHLFLYKTNNMANTDRKRN